MSIEYAILNLLLIVLKFFKLNQIINIQLYSNISDYVFQFKIPNNLNGFFFVDFNGIYFQICVHV